MKFLLGPHPKAWSHAKLPSKIHTPILQMVSAICVLASTQYRSSSRLIRRHQATPCKPVDLSGYAYLNGSSVLASSKLACTHQYACIHQHAATAKNISQLLKAVLTWQRSLICLFETGKAASPRHAGRELSRAGLAGQPGTSFTYSAR